MNSSRDLQTPKPILKTVGLNVSTLKYKNKVFILFPSDTLILDDVKSFLIFHREKTTCTILPEVDLKNLESNFTFPLVIFHVRRPQSLFLVHLCYLLIKLTEYKFNFIQGPTFCFTWWVPIDSLSLILSWFVGTNPLPPQYYHTTLSVTFSQCPGGKVVSSVCSRTTVSVLFYHRSCGWTWGVADSLKTKPRTFGRSVSSWQNWVVLTCLNYTNTRIYLD